MHYDTSLAFGNSCCRQAGSVDVNGQLATFGGIIRAENGSNLTTDPAEGQ